MSRKKGGRPPNPGRFVDPKTVAEIEAALVRQVGNMRRSAVAFDEGHLEEAERLAAAVHILCYDSRKGTKSILTRLDRRDTLWVPDTATLRPPPTEYTATLGPPLLVLWNEGGKFGWRPPLGMQRDKMKVAIFKSWWEQTVYTSASSAGIRLSRKGLVLSLRDQDGGAHVDGELTDEAYSRYSKRGDHGTWNASETIMGRAGPEVSGLHWLTMRQIAWELDCALIEAGIVSAPPSLP